MRTRCLFALAIIASLVLTPAVHAQKTPDDLKMGFMGRYHYAAQRLVALGSVMIPNPELPDKQIESDGKTHRLPAGFAAAPLQR